MPSNRFFFDGPLDDTSGPIPLGGQEYHHLHRVMRTAVGDNVEIINGQGVLAHCTVTELRKEKAILQIVRLDKNPKSNFSLTLAIPLMRPSKLEWIVEKGTEIGVDAFCFYPADRAEKPELSENALERLRQLMIAATKQSGRLYLPSFSGASPFAFSGAILFGDTRGEAPWLSETRKPKADVLFITGPEGGFSPSELALLEKKGVGVKLGHHILRAETAPLVAAALLLATEGSE